MRGRITATIAAVAVLASLCQPVLADDEPEGLRARLRAALHDLHAWVGQGENGRKWRRFLRSSALEEQLAAGEDVDPAILDEALAQYDRTDPVLKLPRVARVRELLRRWRQESSIPPVDELPAIARTAKEEFQPASEEQIRASREATLAALAGLDVYLAPGGANGAAWAEFLDLDRLREQLASDSPQPAELFDVLNNFAVAHQGLSMPVFADVAEALEDYARLVELQQSANSEQEIAAQLDSLAEQIELHATDPTLDRRHVIGVVSGWLERRRQAPRLVRGIRRHFTQPNLFVAVSEGLVGAGINEPVDETEPVRDVILGTSIRGTGTTVGRTRVELVPDDRRAALDVLLEGTTRTRTVGFNGPATIWMRGTTAIAARKRLFIDDEGIHSLRAVSDARTNSTTTGLTTDFGPILRCFADRIAWRQVGKKKGQGERIGSLHAEERVNARMDDQARDLLVESNDAFWQKFRRPLAERGQFPSLLRFRTTGDALFVTARQATAYQLAATGAPPALAGVSDLSIRLHESMLNNLFAGLLSGQKLEQQEVREQLVETFGELPKQLQDDDDKEPWSITFADYQPIVVRFADGGFTIDVHGKAYTSGDRSYQGMNVSAEYKLAVGPNGLKAIRQGDLVIFPPGFKPGERPLSVREQTLRRIVQRRLGKLLAPELESEKPFRLPGKWEAAGDLTPVEYNAADGWLTVAWDRASEVQVASEADAKTAQIQLPR